MGFCTKILPGALYNKLLGIYSRQAVNIFVSILFFVFITAIAITIEKKFKECFRELSWYHVFFILLFVTGPFTFATFVKEFGLIDFFWAFFCLISILLIKNKYFKFLIPALIFLIILVHYSSVTSYVSVLLLIMLFLAADAESKKTRRQYIALFVLSLFTAVGETLYFLKYEYSNLKYSMEEFNNILLNERNADYLEYYDFSFYRSIPDGMQSAMQMNLTDLDTTSLTGFLKNMIYQIKVTLSMSCIEKNWFVGLLAVILFVLLSYVVISYARKTDKTVKKIISLLILPLTVCTALIGIFFSTDFARWLSHSFIVFFAFDLLIIFEDYNTFFEETKTAFEKFAGILSVYMVICMFTTVDIYP